MLSQACTGPCALPLDLHAPRVSSHRLLHVMHTAEHGGRVLTVLRAPPQRCVHEGGCKDPAPASLPLHRRHRHQPQPPTPPPGRHCRTRGPPMLPAYQLKHRGKARLRDGWSRSGGLLAAALGTAGGCPPTLASESLIALEQPAQKPPASMMLGGPAAATATRRACFAHALPLFNALHLPLHAYMQRWGTTHWAAS